MNIIVVVSLCAILSAAVVTDLRSQRIPNILTFPAMLLGLAYHLIVGGPDGGTLDGLWFSLGGFGLGFGLMLIPYMFGFMGAGDVKLMAVVGAWLGPLGAVSAFLATSIFGGLYALILMAGRTDVLKSVFRNLWAASWVFMATRKFNYAPSHETGTLPKMCYGVAIAAGTVASMAWLAFRDGAPFWS